MVTLSLKISIRRSSDQASAPPSLDCQASVRSSHSHSDQPPAYGWIFKQGSSQEQLSPKQRSRADDQQRHSARDPKARARMASDESGDVRVERKKSFGRGGAGNIRRPSDIIYPSKVNADGTRRSSAWSTMSVSVSPGTSPDGRRLSIMGLFRRNSMHGEDGVLGSDDVKKVKFKEVDMGERN